MVSPVMNIIGAGHFGQDFAPVKFSLTVYLAHITFGSMVGWLAQRSNWVPDNLVTDLFGACKPAMASQTRVASNG